MTSPSREDPRTELLLQGSGSEWILYPFLILAALILIGIGWTIASGYGFM
jgi:hypothetical protein